MARQRGATDGVPDEPGKLALETPDDSTDGGTEDSNDTLFEDLNQEVVNRRARSFRRLPQTVWASLHLVWIAARWRFGLTIGLQLMGSVLAGVQVLLGKEALSTVISANRGHAHVSHAAIPLILLAIISALSSVSTVVVAQQQRLLSELVRRRAWDQILDVTGAIELETYEDPTFYDHLQRVESNAVYQPLTVAQGVVSLVGGVGGIGALSIALLTLQPVLVPIILIAGVPLWFLSRRGSRLEFDFALAQAQSFRVRTYLSDVLTGRDSAKEVRAFGLADLLRRRYDGLYDTYVDDLRTQIRKQLRLALIGTSVAALLTSGALVTLLVLVGRGDIGLANAGAAGIAMTLLGSRLSQLFGGIGSILQATLFLNDLETFVQQAPTAEALAALTDAPPEFAKLTVENLSFTYPGSTVPALRNINLEVGAGEIIALVGENGSGKTTLAKLLAQLYSPTEGRIAWDGVDTAKWNRQQVRRRIAVIFQDFVKYHLPAWENIGVGRPEAAEDRAGIKAAARQSGADGFLSKLPMGYDTMLSKEFRAGTDLSIGQWQRVALARAFFRDAPFIILDEPSSALDPRAEHELFESIRELLHDRTVLLISHRFSSVRSADRIYVLEQGELIEHGTHPALMRKKGTYAELFNLQARAYLGETTKRRSG